MKTGHNFAISDHTISKSKNVTKRAITPIAIRTMPFIKPLSLLFSLLIVVSFLSCVENHNYTDDDQDERPEFPYPRDWDEVIYEENQSD